MGAIGSRFGRNVPLEHTFPDPRRPARAEPAHGQPRAPDARREFIPATTLNVLAGAWIQFEVHDWFSHGQTETGEPVAGRRSPTTTRGREHPMEIQRTPRDPSRDPAAAARPTSPRTRTGGTARRSTAATRSSPRRSARGEDGKLRIDDRRPAAAGRSRPDVDLSRGRRQLLARARAAAHAVHAGAQRDLRPAARRVPGLVGRRALRPRPARQRGADREDPHGRVDARDHRPPDDACAAMNANWWGLVGERFTCASAAGRERGHQRHPGLADQHHGVPYSLTEEFVAVYRMHPLHPGRLHVPLADDDRGAAASARSPSSARCTCASGSSELAIADALYSLGVAHPGAITLHNYPRFLQHFNRPDGELLDLAADRHPARPRARRAALQRVPAAAST